MSVAEQGRGSRLGRAYLWCLTPILFLPLVLAMLSVCPPHEAPIVMSILAVLAAFSELRALLLFARTLASGSTFDNLSSGVGVGIASCALLALAYGLWKAL